MKKILIVFAVWGEVFSHYIYFQDGAKLPVTKAIQSLVRADSSDDAKTIFLKSHPSAENVSVTKMKSIDDSKASHFASVEGIELLDTKARTGEK